jgi:hypothetical protein
LRSTNFTDADVAEARQQIVREDFAKSEETRKPLFDKALASLRHGASTTEAAAEIDSACERIGLNSFDVAIEARAHLGKIQAQAWEEAVQLCRDGADTYAAIDVLMKKYGFAWFDAQGVAARAQAKAAEASLRDSS